MKRSSSEKPLRRRKLSEQELSDEGIYRSQLRKKWCKLDGETWPEAFERKRMEED